MGMNIKTFANSALLKELKTTTTAYISFFLSVKRAVVKVSLGNRSNGSLCTLCTNNLDSFLLYPTSLAYRRALNSSIEG